ncbi:hypothetical protein CTEN210_06001 [Chaetoceros tenuissimus]|uniref:Uncharacterized protein n=1 Tax=Chaetoceros tenuissimus TaxID=426638 RepID=A0AAD3CR22_9STRA|nr:hypothetical protein CTEN210_06001 [Chaetoceros tenuissimus]
MSPTVLNPPQPVPETAQVTVTSNKTVVQPQDPKAFSNLLKSIVGSYSFNKRRAIQCAVLFEANRTLESKNILRPKYETQGDNLLSMAKAVIESCPWIPNESRDEILYRTMTKCMPLNPEVARKRLKENILNIKRVIIPAMHQWGYKDDMSHEENCKAYLQDSYEKKYDTANRYTSEWEYKVDFTFLTYRIFYNKDSENTSIPVVNYTVTHTEAAVTPTVRRPVPAPATTTTTTATRPVAAVAVARHPASAPRTPVRNSQANTDMRDEDIEALLSGNRRSRVDDENLQSRKRRALVEEISGQMDLLKKFEGIVPADELNERRRKLYSLVPKMN